MSKQYRRVRANNTTGELLVEYEDIYVNMIGNGYSSNDIIDRKVRISKEQRKLLEYGIVTYQLKQEKNILEQKIINLNETISKREKAAEEMSKIININYTKKEFINQLKQKIENTYKKINSSNLNIEFNKNNLIITITNDINITETLKRKITKIQNDTLVINRTTPESRYEINNLLENIKNIYNINNLNFKESLIINNQNNNVAYKLEKKIHINSQQKLNNGLIKNIISDLKNK